MNPILKLLDECWQRNARLLQHALDAAGFQRFVLLIDYCAAFQPQNQMRVSLAAHLEAQSLQSQRRIHVVDVGRQLHASDMSGSSTKCTRTRWGLWDGSKYPFATSAIIGSNSAKELPCLVRQPPPGVSSQGAAKPPVSRHGSTRKEISFIFVSGLRGHRKHESTGIVRWAARTVVQVFAERTPAPPSQIQHPQTNIL